LVYSAILDNDGRMRRHCDIRPDTPELKTLINVIVSYSAYSDARLIEAAVQRRGLSNSDGGFGVIYPSDLDDYDRATQPLIPPGFVCVYTFFGARDGDEFTIPESLYLEVLELWLFMRDVKHEAITALRKTLNAS
jgi:hypothetical protein